MTRTCKYPNCDIEISLTNESGYCGWHRDQARRETEYRPLCRHQKCHYTVSPQSRSGLCRIHSHTDREEKRK